MKPEAYRDMTFEEIKGHLVEDRLATYQSLTIWGPVTTRRLAEFMRRDILTVRPRVTELCQMGLARLADKAGSGREGLYVAVPLVEAERRRKYGIACEVQAEMQLGGV